MKLLALGLLAVIGSASVLLVWQPVRVQTYLIPSNMQPRWITIEHENPKCAPMKEGLLGREYVIPDSGYLCTSSPMNTDWVYFRYYSVDSQGKRTPLRYKEQIFKVASFNTNDGSCKVTAEEFFYGSKDKLTSENPIMFDEAFLREHHPECRERGIITTQTP